jgi:hypothetical protein
MIRIRSAYQAKYVTKTLTRFEYLWQRTRRPGRDWNSNFDALKFTSIKKKGVLRLGGTRDRAAWGNLRGAFQPF